ncbi:MAG: alpha/beta hydrolase-fold protein [Bacteroidota bacterium]
MNTQLTKVLLIIALVNCLSSKAQQGLSKKEPIDVGNQYTFYSQVLNEQREIWIRVPSGYIVDDITKYPVIYLLDGNNNFIFTAGLLRQLEIRSVPKSILVGIVNTDRTRDLTPATTEDEPGSGGADQFLEMLRTEMFPLVESNFRTNGHRTIIGHSDGGLLAIYSLAKYPELFDAYLAISPSLWWDDQKVVDLFEERLKENAKVKALLYMTMASERGKMLGGMMKLVGALESQAPENLRWDYKVYPNEHHGSIPVVSAVEGFHFFYKDWHIPSPEFEAYGLTTIRERKKRIQKEFGTAWEPEDIIYDDLLWDLVESGRYEETILLSERLISAGKEVVDFHETAALAYMALDSLESAKHHWGEVYRLNPGYEDGIEMTDSLNIDKAKLLTTYLPKGKALEVLSGFYSDGESTCTIELKDGKLRMLLKAPFFTINDELIAFKKNRFYVPEDYFTVEFQFENEVRQASHLVVQGTYGWSNRMIRID